MFCCLEHYEWMATRECDMFGQRCQVGYWIGPQLVIRSDNPAVSEITFCVQDVTASLVIFPSIKKYRLCNKRHTLQIDSVPQLCETARIQQVVATEKCFCSAEWVHLQYFTKIPCITEVCWQKKCPMSTSPYKRTQKSGKNRVSLLDDACLILSWNACRQNNINCCDKNLHAAQEIPFCDHEVQRVQTKLRSPCF